MKPATRVAWDSLTRHAAAVTDRLKALGFDYVALDLQGFRSGSMNEVLPRATVACGLVAPVGGS